MEEEKFDAFTRVLVGSSVSRRQLLQRFAGGLVGIAAATIIPERVWAAKGGNSSCAHFCDMVFGDDTPGADACISAAAHHMGLCYQCGPAQPGTVGLCGTTCGCALNTCPSVCGTYQVCGSDTLGVCSCSSTTEGGSFCFSDVLCAADVICTTSVDCPTGQSCIPNTCCGTNVCLPPCGTALAAPTGAGPRPSGN